MWLRVERAHEFSCRLAGLGSIYTILYILSCTKSVVDESHTADADFIELNLMHR